MKKETAKTEQTIHTPLLQEIIYSSSTAQLWRSSTMKQKQTNWQLFSC